jgi:hypothetical protein
MPSCGQNEWGTSFGVPVHLVDSSEMRIGESLFDGTKKLATLVIVKEFFVQAWLMSLSAAPI